MAIALADDHSTQIALPDTIERHLQSRDRAYLTRTNNDIAKLNIAERTLEKKIKELDAIVADTPEARKSRELRAKLKLTRQMRTEKVMRAQGVLESALAEIAPGKDFADMVADGIPMPEPAQLGRPRKGGRR